MTKIMTKEEADIFIERMESATELEIQWWATQWVPPKPCRP